jgi:hypothetical protein
MKTLTNTTSLHPGLPIWVKKKSDERQNRTAGIQQSHSIAVWLQAGQIEKKEPRKVLPRGHTIQQS